MAIYFPSIDLIFEPSLGLWLDNDLKINKYLADFKDFTAQLIGIDLSTLALRRDLYVKDGKLRRYILTNLPGTNATCLEPNGAYQEFDISNYKDCKTRKLVKLENPQDMWLATKLEPEQESLIAGLKIKIEFLDKKLLAFVNLNL